MQKINILVNFRLTGRYKIYTTTKNVFYTKFT